MKSTSKIALASVVLGGLALSSGNAQTYINPSSPPPLAPLAPNGLALLNGWDFDNITGSNLPASPVRGRYSDVWGNLSSGLTTAGGIYFNGSFGSDNWGTVAKTATGDANRDILTRVGAGSTFDLGGQTGAEGATNFNNANVGVTFSKFSLNVKTLDAVNTGGFKDIKMSLWGRDSGTSPSGITINWLYSVDGGATQISTGLTSTFAGAAFAESVLDFSAITALNSKTDIYLIGQVVESAVGAVLSLDNIGVYGTAVIPEPSTYAAMLAAMTAGVVALRRRKSVVAV